MSIPTNDATTVSLPRAAGLAALGAAFGNVILFVILKATGTELRIPSSPGGSELTDLTTGPVVFATIIPVLLSGVLAWLLARFVPGSAATIFLVVGVGFTLLSMGGPLSLDVPTETKVALAAMHVVAAAIALPMIAKAIRR